MLLGQKRILVTGGAGFLGTHLCRRLLGQGHEILCVDNFSTGTRRNIEELLDNPLIELLRHNVTFPLLSKWTKSITLPVQPRRFITSATLFKQRKRACLARSTCSASPSV
jgi:nucleoside-diphosphate-sugar epimerase